MARAHGAMLGGDRANPCRFWWEHAMTSQALPGLIRWVAALGLLYLLSGPPLARAEVRDRRVPDGRILRPPVEMARWSPGKKSASVRQVSSQERPQLGILRGSPVRFPPP